MTRGYGKFGYVARRAVALVAGGACLAALPSAVAAVTGDSPATAVRLAARGGLGSFTPASVDPELLEQLRMTLDSGNSGSSSFRFTPAGANQRGSRAITVAVRVDSETARAASVRQAIAESTGAAIGATPGIAPVAFNLGMARGYQSFAQPSSAQSSSAQSSAATSAAGTRKLTLPSDIRDIDAPDLSSFTPARSSGSGRFSPRVELEEEHLPGRAPRTLEGEGDVSVDVGGAYRVTRNVKVTAGIRYSSDRDRSIALTDRTTDSQAVYVGTQFRF